MTGNILSKGLPAAPGSKSSSPRLPHVLLVFALQFVFLLGGRAQVAGPGSDDVRNQPGHVKPPEPRELLPAPKEPTDPQVKAVLDQMAAAGVLHPKTLEQAQKTYLFYTKFSGPPEKVFRVEDRAVPGPAGDIPIRVYLPRSGEGFPIWVFFHGGGFVGGSLDTHDVALRAVTNRCDCAVVSVGYRLAPGSHYPAAANEAYTATNWVAGHATEIAGDPKRIALGGDGAGGNLAVVVALMARDRGGPHLVYEALIYPILNAIQISYSWIASADPVLNSDVMSAKWSQYVPFNADLRDPYISPVNSPDLRNLPSTLILTSENDPVRDDADRFGRNLSDAGVPVRVSVYPNAIHGFFLMAGALDAGKKAIAEIASSLRATFESSR